MYICKPGVLQDGTPEVAIPVGRELPEDQAPDLE